MESMFLGPLSIKTSICDLDAYKLSPKTKYLANFKARGTLQETRNRKQRKRYISEKHHKRSP
jgi:hypothetical protein